MKNRRLFCIHTAILGVLLFPAPMPAQGPVNPDISVPDLGPGPPLVPRGSDPAPGLYGLTSGAGQVYTIDATTGEATFLVASNGLSSFVGLSFLACDAYGSDLDSFPGGSGGFDVGQIDLASGVITFLSDQDGSANWHGLATDEGAGLLYSIDIDDGNILKSLAADGTVTSIGAGSGIDGRGMAFDDANGILYATDSTTASLYTVSLADGTATLVGPTGLGDLGEVGLAYDEADDILYLNDAITASLYTVSAIDGGATLVGANLFPNIDGLAWFGDNTCAGPTCGDGVVNPLFEQCDDGNMVDGDGCDNNCRLSIVTPPNSCDSGLECIFDGFLNQAIGNATLSLLQDDTVLLVDNIGSTGLDGVRQFVPITTEMRTDLVKPNFSQSTAGAELITTQTGIVDGKDGQLFSTLTITNDGESLQVLAVWIDTTSYGVRVYLDQTLVTNQQGLDSGLLSLPIQDIGGLDCDVNGELTGDTDPPVLVTIPGRGDFFGDNWVIATEDATSAAEAQEIIEMLARNTGPIQILHEFTTPPPGPFVSLFSDGFESGDTSAWSSTVGE